MESSAQKLFEIENNIETIDSARDQIYEFDEAENKKILESRPWKEDPNYFKHARISAIALLKMTIHARSGGPIEVMGMMTGKVLGDSIVVMDAFPLPVEGTETRVNPQAEAYEYMVEYLSTLQKVGRKEHIIGWYHSHPGYGCWLSGIDVGTQSQNQQFQDPFLAVVIDPNRTISAGKVEIGAFRTYPENYLPLDQADSEYQTIPLAKMEDFGAHARQYYALEVSHFKSSLDTKLLELLWNKYWVSTLSQSTSLTNREYATLQMFDLSRKVPLAESVLSSSLSTSPMFQTRSALVSSLSGRETELDKVVRDTSKVVSEEVHGLLSDVVKDRLFSNLKASVN
ncbi:JAB1/Mov34/MPN/PAD-1 ubiquitin protease-domain-containing protein [Lipomyces oligophaga]|uniref:JAB1/Mov34/MPN/PAD-1 ubiquitin protease-domain-containing protein n=1 Tax=Lipomyces oligophaga TaxID=45792 RepID=UPI0034CF0298